MTTYPRLSSEFTRQDKTETDNWADHRDYEAIAQHVRVPQEPYSYLIFTETVDGTPWYYAKNGTTGLIESSSTDAYTVLTYALGTGDVSIYLDKGTFITSANIVLPSDVSIIGAGPTITIVQGASGVLRIFDKPFEVRDITIKDITIKGASEAGQVGLWIEAGSQCIFDNLRISNVGVGSYIEYASGNNLVFRHVIINQFTVAGFQFSTGNQVHLYDCQVAAPTQSGGMVGILFEPYTGRTANTTGGLMDVYGGHFWFCTDCLKWTGSAYMRWAKINFYGTEFEGFDNLATIEQPARAGYINFWGCITYCNSISSKIIHAVDLTALLSYFSFYDCSFIGPVAAGFVFSDTSSNYVVFDLLGYNRFSNMDTVKTRNYGIATILSGAVSVVIPHGLFEYNQYTTTVCLGPKHAEVSQAVWTADATNLTITVPSAVSADRKISYVIVGYALMG